jgi:hypothetical protein
MPTQGAQHSLPKRSMLTTAVLSRRQLATLGVGRGQIAAQLEAHRWQLCGRAVVLHNGALTRRQRWLVACVNAGPQTILTAFTAAEASGLKGWERDAVHVLGPPGTPNPAVPGMTVRVHRETHWQQVRHHGMVHDLLAALIRATSTFDSVRPACGLLAAAVQQRLTDASALRSTLLVAVKTRHRAALIAVLGDIEQGSQALSEIDFFALCRRFRLPLPQRQTVRRDSSGRRRYLDATWQRSDGRLVVVEVDGALHLNATRWWDDQHRQNELSLADALVLRFPSVIVRSDPTTVAQQLRRALMLT